jgi:large subunit ribosomal protein L28
MSYVCEHCRKGVKHGSAVSHAKNRVARLFKPNLQKLKVIKNGMVFRIRLCTTCIKRLRKYGKFGALTLPTYTAKVAVKAESRPAVTVKTEVKKAVKAKEAKVEKAEKARETLDISAIVGKKS